MPRSRPASDPVSYHKQTGQFYITRLGHRIYLGADKPEALRKYHALAMGVDPFASRQAADPTSEQLMSVKELASRYIAAQKANWRTELAEANYRNWLGRFLKDHPQLRVGELNVERFAAWKLSLRKRGYAPDSINHYLKAVRAMFRFAEDVDLIERAPKLHRVKNEPQRYADSADKPVYSPHHIQRLLREADIHLRAMILLALNCGFGPKDIHDLGWSHLKAGRLSLARSKTGVRQTYALWPETVEAVEAVRQDRNGRTQRAARRGHWRSDEGRIFITRFWKPWSKDAVSEQFRRLCKQAKVTCHGFYRLRHCASTAIAEVAMPHVQRRFMRHRRLQQQVTYTHIQDEAVEKAIMEARLRLLGTVQLKKGSGTDRGRSGVA